ncbi:MAG: LysR family transcriptional regulator, partial [Thiolinea sp.]
MAKDITLRQLRYFVAAAESGQLSLAAKTSHVAQSTVTNAILTLETSLGIDLFQRKPNGVTLTADGYKFYHRAKHILDSLDIAISEPQFQTHELSGSISLAASYTLLGYYLPSRMARFRQQYPDIDIDLRALERPDIEEQVASGKVELGVVILSNLKDRERFHHHVLLRSRRQLWTASNHPLQEQEFASLQDISQYPYILITADEVENVTE